ncbi:uncharacterized protein LOC119349062 [Triticum dicoccoides]|uniref:uncharacterized protein LOC119349062 n=1 Tax=Triticum dicoccoides TaxID=85692 RepID=UPI00188FDF38|nr:uncharacterized protein LOC119349062 [Triticum dicoccoides]XP_044319172.1 uncharacterized protein LOC123040372 [Triticum aestivum]XP_044367953.1 uncharacterized protein LOC123090686 [Triticum aestivum]
MESRDRSPSTNAMRIWRVLTHQDPMTDKVYKIACSRMDIVAHGSITFGLVWCSPVRDEFRRMKQRLGDREITLEVCCLVPDPPRSELALSSSHADIGILPCFFHGLMNLPSPA